MLGTKIKIVDDDQTANRPVVLSTEKRSDKWSLLLVAVGESKDRKAFAQLFAHFAPLLKSFAHASRHEGWFPGLSEDLVQEVMIKVWNKAAGYKPEKASATTWIYTVARNCRIDMLRRKSNTQHLPLENEDFWHEPDEETPVSLLRQKRSEDKVQAVSHTHLRAHETRHELVCRLLFEKNKLTKSHAIQEITSNEIILDITYHWLFNTSLRP